MKTIFTFFELFITGRSQTPSRPTLLPRSQWPIGVTSDSARAPQHEAWDCTCSCAINNDDNTFLLMSRVLSNSLSPMAAVRCTGTRKCAACWVTFYLSFLWDSGVYGPGPWSGETRQFGHLAFIHST